MVNLPNRTTRPQPATPTEAVNAPLFRRLIEGLSAERRSVVLDLGPARTETVACFGQFRCRLDVADIAGGLAELDAEVDPQVLREKVEALLPPRRQEPTDIILCWDLLNYLQRPALTAMMECIARRTRRGSFAHMMIVYSGTKMPATPGQYVPLPDCRLMPMATSPAERNAPRYSPEDLGQCLRGYVVEGAVLLRNGMQEFLFRT